MGPLRLGGRFLGGCVGVVVALGVGFESEGGWPLATGVADVDSAMLVGCQVKVARCTEVRPDSSSIRVQAQRFGRVCSVRVVELNVTMTRDRITQSLP